METWRSLTSEEISQLHTQRCKAEDWSRIRVSTDFQVKYVRESTLSGDIRLGRFGKKVMLPGGVPVESGVYRAHLHNCTVADNVYISHVSQYIANYTIGEGTIIENIGALYTDGESSFGNGTSVSVLDETGGRSVLIYEGLSAQTAHVIVMHPHRPQVLSHLHRLAQEKARSVRSGVGTIGASCCIRHSGTLRNLRIGDGCEINGASLLDDGSLCSATSAFRGEGSEPMLTTAYVGADVIARHFIFASGSVVKDGVQLERCFVGEAAELSKGFSAHDSLFFANSQMENGEACASFLGPYCVSMHKSTLMVGGKFSFCNFGSGTNQSNHFYKLGPMHSGVCERGCKTGSGAYLLWPARIGAFTFIKGSHTGNPDTSDYPYSYLIEEGGHSVLTPGASIRSVGTLRDLMKWPQRDKRTALIPADKICFDANNPYVAEAMYRSINSMEHLLADSSEAEFKMNGFFVRRSAMVRGLKLYKTSLEIYKGSQLILQLERFREEHLAPGALIKNLLAHVHTPSTEWADLSGLLLPQPELDALLDAFESGAFATAEEVEANWEKLFRKYTHWSWQSALYRIASDEGKSAQELQADDFCRLIDAWKEAMESIYQQMLHDAELELTMVQRHLPGMDSEHPFHRVLKKLLLELPAHASLYKSMLR
jgi:acetyltransferase-like isoleucine patch superfamily enzyme